MPMTDDEKLRFTSDLNTIRNAVKGKDVKDSIHDALELVGKYSGTGSGGDIDDIVEALGGLSFVKCTRAEYDAMSSHKNNTIYIIVEEDTA